MFLGGIFTYALLDWKIGSDPKKKNPTIEHTGRILYWTEPWRILTTSLTCSAQTESYQAFKNSEKENQSLNVRREHKWIVG